MNRRSTPQPLRAVREHIAAALGACAGMLAITLLVIGIELTR